jgi:hypothetical protein
MAALYVPSTEKNGEGSVFITPMDRKGERCHIKKKHDIYRERGTMKLDGLDNGNV